MSDSYPMPDSGIRHSTDTKCEMAGIAVLTGLMSTVGFPIVISCVTAALALLTASQCGGILHLPSFLYGTVLWCWWGFVASFLWALGRKFPVMLRFTPKVFGLHLLAGLALATVHLLLLGSVHFSVASWRTEASVAATWLRRLSFNAIGFDLLVYGFIVGTIAVVRLQFLSQQEAIRSLELQRRLSASQLHALQMQLEPHFLFNTLNAITMLMRLGRHEEAINTLGHLNDILHSTLRRSAPEKIPLFQELETVNHYLAIEQMRFSDRLQIVNSIDPEALDGLVPSFLLQPLVENAIRHGIANCEERGIIHTSAVRESEQLFLRVHDNGPGLSDKPQPGHGIGLKNTGERLAHFYADRFQLQVSSPASGGFEVCVTIPYERNSR